MINTYHRRIHCMPLSVSEKSLFLCDFLNYSSQVIFEYYDLTIASHKPPKCAAEDLKCHQSLTRLECTTFYCGDLKHEIFALKKSVQQSLYKILAQIFTQQSSAILGWPSSFKLSFKLFPHIDMDHVRIYLYIYLRKRNTHKISLLWKSIAYTWSYQKY